MEVWEYSIKNAANNLLCLAVKDYGIQGGSR